jgi:integrase
MIPFIDLYAASEPIVPPPAVVPGAMPWPAFTAELLEQYDLSGRARTTRRGMARALAVLASYGVQTTHDLTTTRITAVVKGHRVGHASNTTRNLLVNASVACDHAVKTGRLAVSPFAIIPFKSWVKPSIPTGKLALTAGEVRSLLDVLALDVAQRKGFALWAARRLQALVATIVYTGLRLGEATWLELDDVDLVNGIIFVVDRDAHHLKTAKAQQPVIVPTALAPVLRDWFLHRDDAPEGMVRKPSKYVFRQWMAVTPWRNGCHGYRPLERLQAVGKRAGIEYVSFLMLRRTVATIMELTCTDSMIMRQLRHSSPEIGRKHYRKADISSMRDSMSSFDY